MTRPSLDAIRRVLLLLLLTGLLVVSGTGNLTAQVRTDSLSNASSMDSSALYFRIPNGFSLGFEHVLSLYDWHSTVHWASEQQTGRVAPFDYQVHLVGDSRLQSDNEARTTEATALITGTQSLDASGLLRPFITLYGTSYISSAIPGQLPSTALITKQVDGFAIAGIRSRALTSDSDLSLGVGLARQSQPNTSAYGFVIRGDAAVPAIAVGEASYVGGSAAADERFFRERGQRFSSDRISFRSISQFDPNDAGGGRNEAFLNLGLLRRDFFLSLDSTSEPAKQERTEMSLLLIDSLRYPLAGDKLLGNLGLEFEPRSVTRRSDVSNALSSAGNYSALSSLLVPNQISSLRLAASGRFAYTPLSQFGAQFLMRYEERSEDVALLSDELTGVPPASIRKLSSTLDQASYSARTTQSTVTLTYEPTSLDALTADINARLLNYDTPNPDNHDDHDDLVTSGRLAYTRTFAAGLTGGLEVRASRSHLVYLLSDRSAQNNVTRSVALATSADYVAPAMTTSIRGEIFANYTVLDYLDSLPILQSVGSYVLRGLTLHDTTMVPLGIYPLPGAQALAAEAECDLRVNERGAYAESNFSERRNTTVSELTASLLLSLTSASGSAPWTLKAGVRGFLLRRYGVSEATLATSLANSYEELERQSRIGPFAMIDLTRADDAGPMLTGSIWYAVIRSQTFDVPDTIRRPQLESHLSVRWRL